MQYTWLCPCAYPSVPCRRTAIPHNMHTYTDIHTCTYIPISTCTYISEDIYRPAVLLPLLRCLGGKGCGGLGLGLSRERVEAAVQVQQARLLLRALRDRACARACVCACEWPDRLASFFAKSCATRLGPQTLRRARASRTCAFVCVRLCVRCKAAHAQSGRRVRRARADGLSPSALCRRRASGPPSSTPARRLAWVRACVCVSLCARACVCGCNVCVWLSMCARVPVCVYARVRVQACVRAASVGAWVWVVSFVSFRHAASEVS
jgi:hypothetical protein